MSFAVLRDKLYPYRVKGKPLLEVARILTYKLMFQLKISWLEVYNYSLPVKCFLMVWHIVLNSNKQRIALCWWSYFDYMPKLAHTYIYVLWNLKREIRWGFALVSKCARKLTKNCTQRIQHGNLRCLCFHFVLLDIYVKDLMFHVLCELLPPFRSFNVASSLCVAIN